MQKSKYDENSIKSLDDRSHVRLRPAMYIGDTGIYGLHHLVYEVADNSVDEITNGFGSLIQCKIHKDGSVTITDDGRGIPVGIQSDTGKSAAETVMTSLRSGGKFDNDNYSTSSGLHGIGVSAVNFLSESLDLTIVREGFIWKQSYKKGIPVEALKKCEASDATGTIIRFKPDRSIFQTVEFQYKTLHARLKELAYLNRGVKIIVEDENSGEKAEFYSDGGISAFVIDLNKDKETLSPIILLDDEVKVKKEDKAYKVKIEIAFQYNKAYSDIVYSFANNINTRDGGSHLSGFKSALLDAIVAYAEKKKMFKGLDIRPTPRDVLEGLTAVISIKLPNPEFEGQTKATLGNPEIKQIVYQQVNDAIASYFAHHEDVATTITEKISQACIAREEARKARDTVRRKNILSSSSLPGKLADCSEKNPDLCEVFVVEGDCFKGDTLIHTINGLRRLDSIKTGDLIYTHMHRYRPAMERKPIIKRKKCRIVIQGKIFVCSQDHLWGVLRANDNECEWVQAKDLKITDLIVKTVLPGEEYCKVVDIREFINS
ncbi:MAG: ATP-binding protein [Nitrosarchaeum sp.]|nr:ATP-binding protein [Nitrosarchaeum sp.]